MHKCRLKNNNNGAHYIDLRAGRWEMHTVYRQKITFKSGDFLFTRGGNEKTKLGVGGIFFSKLEIDNSHYLLLALP